MLPLLWQWNIIKMKTTPAANASDTKEWQPWRETGWKGNLGVLSEDVYFREMVFQWRLWMSRGYFWKGQMLHPGPMFSHFLQRRPVTFRYVNKVPWNSRPSQNKDSLCSLFTLCLRPFAVCLLAPAVLKTWNAEKNGTNIPKPGKGDTRCDFREPMAVTDHTVFKRLNYVY